MDLNPDTAPPSHNLSDNDILEAMRDIPGYLDITVADFRAIYTLASNHAVKRVFNHIRARDLMRNDVHPVGPDAMLSTAAQSMAEQQLKSLPVVDPDGLVVGMLTETDFLRRLQATGFMELMLRLMTNPTDFSHQCHATPVRAAMSTSVISVQQEAGFTDIVAAFRCCPGRSLPVLDAQGRYQGLLLRKQFITACQFEPAA